MQVVGSSPTGGTRSSYKGLIEKGSIVDQTTQLKNFFEMHARVNERAESLEQLVEKNADMPYIPVNPLALAQEAVLLRVLNHALVQLYEGHLELRELLTKTIYEYNQK